MTVEQVRARVEEIENNKEDDEKAHGMEDGLWEDVLYAIAHGFPNADELAGEALKTKLIDFERWYA